MKKHILVFGAGKSSACLIDYLLKACAIFHWHLTVADTNLRAAANRTGNAAHATAVCLQVEDAARRADLIMTADLVISLLPPALHFLVAKDCIAYQKHLLTASYIDEQIAGLAPAIKAGNLLFVCEMGLDPGIDHMSAMKLIHHIRKQGGRITSFVSHCGGLVAPESDDNPWHYKVSWNPRSVVRAGSAGALYKETNTIVQKTYGQVFSDCRAVNVPGAGMLAYYPNRDALRYMDLYDLQSAGTFIRTTLRYPAFCSGWNTLVHAGLTDDVHPLAAEGLTYKKWSEGIVPFVDAGNKALFEFIGLFDDVPIPAHCATAADVLQYLLETKLALRAGDRDMIVMLHDITYQTGDKTSNTIHTLVVKGHDDVHTAMAKTVGLPLGIATKLILQQKITLTGLHIPVAAEIYEPVLQELALHGIVFSEHSSEP